jgi:hypothetical protein
MKTIAKLGLVGLALAASSAYADVAPPSTGNGELTLFVRNDTTGVVYARGLQVSLDAFLTQAQINAGFSGNVDTGAVQQLNYVLGTVGPDANLAGFLNGTNSFSWTIMAGDSQGSNNADPARRYLTTTQLLLGDPEANSAAMPNFVDNGSLITFSSLEAMSTLVNNNIAGSTYGDGGSTAVNGQWRQAAAIPGFAAGDWFGAGPDTVNALGTAAHLYILTTSGGGSGGLARTYQGLDVILSSNGTLSAVAAVPLPGAIWMLASGILTLAGVKRRGAQPAA